MLSSNISYASAGDLQVYLDADNPSGNGVIPNEGDNISFWKDLTNNGYNFGFVDYGYSNFNYFNPPRFRVINGRRYVSFREPGNILTFLACEKQDDYKGASSIGYTLFIKLKHLNVPYNYNSIFCDKSRYLASDIGISVLRYFNGYENDTGGTFTYMGGTIIPDRDDVIAFVLSNSSMSAWAANGLKDKDSMSHYNFLRGASFRPLLCEELGGDGASLGGSRGGDMKISKLLIYKGPLDQERFNRVYSSLLNSK